MKDRLADFFRQTLLPVVRDLSGKGWGQHDGILAAPFAEGRELVWHLVSFAEDPRYIFTLRALGVGHDGIFMAFVDMGVLHCRIETRQRVLHFETPASGGDDPVLTGDFDAATLAGMYPTGPVSGVLCMDAATLAVNGASA